MACTAQWPVVGSCSGHGTCYNTSAPAAASLSDLSYGGEVCSCDEDWLNRSDLLLNACITHAIAFRVLWSCALLIASLCTSFSWFVLFRACSKYWRTASVVGSTAESRAGGKPGTRSLVASNTRSCLGAVHRLWTSLASRLALFSGVSAPCAVTLALLKLTRFQMVGFDAPATVMSITGILFYWLSAYCALYGFVSFNLSVLAAHFSLRDKHSAERKLRFFQVRL
jgi:hypothetical protein